MLRFSHLVILVAFSVGLPSCASFHREKCSSQDAYVDGQYWEKGTFGEFQIDSTRIQRMLNELEVHRHEIDALLMVVKGKVIVEEYYNGYCKNSLHDLRSVTKSIRSLLMGIAIDQGYVESVDQPIDAYIPRGWIGGDSSSIKQSITIRHLLSMTSGLDCNDWDSNSLGQEDRVYALQDWLKYFLHLPLLHQPGSVGAYCSMGQILAMDILERATKYSVDSFAQAYLFEELGIYGAQWGHTRQEDVISSGRRLYMRPIDMAAIGQLVLNKGQWHGKQLVSRQWVEESTSVETTIGGQHYGLSWWSIPVEVSGREYKVTAATGNGGQYIFIVPSLDAVVVFTGSAFNSPKDKIPFGVLRDVLIPSMTDHFIPQT